MGWLRTVFYALAVTGGLLEPAAARCVKSKCPLREVPQYEYSCKVQGLIRKPATLAVENNITLASTCAHACLDDDKCKSFRWVDETSKCYLYSKYLSQMFTDFSNHQPGFLYERECWTTECDLIAACTASSSCNLAYIQGEGYDYTEYYQYACSYGKTARSTNSHGRSFRVFKRIHYHKSYTACNAIYGCASEIYHGSFDVHFDLVLNRWECVIYDDLVNGAGTNPTLDQEHISRTRYSVTNDSVGAGYGFMWQYSYGQRF